MIKVKKGLKINEKIDFLDVNNNIIYTSIYDFAYKRRMRVFDFDENEIAYVNLKIVGLNEVEKIYEVNDQELRTYVQEDEYVKSDDDYLYVEDEDIYKAILYILVTIDKES